jgi:N-acetylmuramoyl-L-alanine amidase
MVIRHIHIKKGGQGENGLKKNRTWLINRKKVSIIGLILLLVLVCIFSDRSKLTNEKMVLSYHLANKIIVVDPGHGGIDPGAWRGNLEEKDITLQIGQKLAGQLSQAGALVVLLRNDDSDLVEDGFEGSIRERKRKDLATRAEKANEVGADLYVSIHVNADPSPRWSGAQTFYYPKSETSKLFAESIQSELIRIMGNTTRKAKTGDYFIMEHTKIPTVIIEVGFISNPGEAQLLTQDDYQSKLVFAIFSGIVKAQAAKNDHQPYAVKAE